jgi:hypothetical protein
MDGRRALPTPVPDAGTPPPLSAWGRESSYYDQRDVEAMLSFGLAPSEQIAEAQARVNEREERVVRHSSLASLTFDTAVLEAREALVGLLADLSGSTARKGLADMLTHGNRLRGLGILLVALAVIGLFVDYVMYPSLPPFPARPVTAP